MKLLFFILLQIASTAEVTRVINQTIAGRAVTLVEVKVKNQNNNTLVFSRYLSDSEKALWDGKTSDQAAVREKLYSQVLKLLTAQEIAASDTSQNINVSGIPKETNLDLGAKKTLILAQITIQEDIIKQEEAKKTPDKQVIQNAQLEIERLKTILP